MANSIQRDLKDSRYRFAYDLVAEVAAIRGDTSQLPPNLPAPDIILFTQQHAKWMEDFLVHDCQARTLDMWINENGTSSLESLMEVCKGQYIAESSSTFCQEQEFILACAKIAYIAAYFFKKRRIPGARNKALEFIHKWILSSPPRFIISLSHLR
ncbi:unnamed protein product [Larinioides sclopetarius]|uniref:Uncharacterized protein n=1 Tax=Larinioides sclopetarius TaxID=280406 RepID=A0AAV1ZS15_9ARAC